MNNSNLQILEMQGCRFCRIDYAKKGPTYKGWQDSPFLLQSIPTTGNVGVLTGVHSNGLLAIDFDGPWATQYWQQHIGLELPETVTWSSGRPARWQMGYFVPQEMWPHINTFKITEPGITKDGRKPDGLEFRWNGVQSVLPPSMHPDTHKPYQWIVSPEDSLITELPIDILEFMLAYSPPDKEYDCDIEEVTIADLTLDKFEECENILRQLKRHYPVLGYDDWIRVTWATVSHIGTEAGLTLLRDLWPEQSTGEYKKLLRGFDLGRSPKFGTLVQMVAKHNAPKKQTIKQQFNPRTKITF